MMEKLGFLDFFKSSMVMVKVIHNLRHRLLATVVESMSTSADIDQLDGNSIFIQITAYI
jgi:hypothetical protein